MMKPYISESIYMHVFVEVGNNKMVRTVFTNLNDKTADKDDRGKKKAAVHHT